MISASSSLRFFNKAPCPDGLNNNDPSSSLNGLSFKVTAIVSVDSCWYENEISKETPVLCSTYSSIRLNSSSNLSLKRSEIVKWSSALLLTEAYNADS